MLLIVTALHSEARPLIDHFELKKNPDSKRLDLFENEKIKLIVSGIGKIRSATAVSYLLTKHIGFNSVVVNIGISGSINNKRAIGELCYIHKIVDHATGREFFPENFLVHGLPEAAVETFDRPVEGNEKESIAGDIVDMEASGFYQAASMFVETQRIYCLKIVSDHLELSHISKEFVSDIVRQNAPRLGKFFDHVMKFHLTEPDLLTAEEQKSIETISANLNLTAVQSDRFSAWCRSAKVKGQDLAAQLKPFLSIKYKAKSENKNALERIRQALHS